MDLRGLIQGLVGPDREPPEPYRRSRGHLLFPSASARYENEAKEVKPLPAHWQPVLLPAPAEGPTWPYERWLIESFGFEWTYSLGLAEVVPEGGSTLTLIFELLAGGEVRWSETVQRALVTQTSAKGSQYANLSAPVQIQGGEIPSLRVTVEPAERFNTRSEVVTVNAFRIPNSVDHGGG